MIVNAPSHWMRPPKLVAIWLLRPPPLSGVRLTLPLVTGEPSGFETRPVIRAMRTSSIPKLMSSTSWLRPTDTAFASFTDGTPG